MPAESFPHFPPDPAHDQLTPADRERVDLLRRTAAEAAATRLALVARIRADVVRDRGLRAALRALPPLAGPVG